MTSLTDSVAENAVKMSGDQVTAVDKFDTASRGLRDTIGGLTTGVGSALIPVLTKLIDGVQAAIPILKETFTPIWNALKEVWLELQPTLKQLGTTLTQDLLPALQKMWKAIAPVLIPAIKDIGSGCSAITSKPPLRLSLVRSVGVAALLTGDFAGCLERQLKRSPQGVMNHASSGSITTPWAGCPGVSKIDMADFADNVEDAVDQGG